MPSSVSKTIFDHRANNKSSFWKARNKRNKAKRLAKLFVVIVVAFALVNFVVKIPGWFQSINKPFDQIQTNLSLDGKDNSNIRTNILLVSISDNNDLQDLALASFNSSKSTLTIIDIPVSPKTYLVGAERELSLSAAYFSKPYLDSEFDSLYLAVQETIALPIDGYFAFFVSNLEFSEDTIQETKNKLGFFGLFKNSLNYKSWLNSNLKTNYSVFSLSNLLLDFRQINSTDIGFISVSEAVENKQFIFDKVDSVVRSSVLDNTIAREAAVVEITSGGSNYKLIKRLVNNLGASTINIGVSTKDRETRVVLNSDKEIIANRVAGFLNVKVEKGVDIGGSDVEVIIGSDFEDLFYGN